MAPIRELLVPRSQLLVSSSAHCTASYRDRANSLQPGKEEEEEETMLVCSCTLQHQISQDAPARSTATSHRTSETVCHSSRTKSEIRQAISDETKNVLSMAQFQLLGRAGTTTFAPAAPPGQKPSQSAYVCKTAHQDHLIHAHAKITKE